MAVGYVASTNGLETSATSTMTINHTPCAGTDLILCAIVCVHRSAKVMNTVVYDPAGENKSFTKFATLVNNLEITIWYLLDADIINSTAKDIVFTPDANSRMAGTIIELSGVDQTTPLESAQSGTVAAGTSIATGTITSGADDITVGRMFSSANVAGLAAGTGQTELQNADTNLGYAGCSYADPGVATHDWSWSSPSRDGGILACNVKAAGGGPAANPKGPLGMPFYGPFGGPVRRRI